MVDCCAKLRLLFIQLLATFFLDCIPRFWRWLTCASVKTDPVVRVLGVPAVRDLFQLDPVEGLVYPDPHRCGDVATVVCAFRPQQPVPYERVVDEGPDGNPICLDFFLVDSTSSDDDVCAQDKTPCRRAACATMVVIIPGLASFSQTNYIERLVWQFHFHGCHVCVMNARGLGDTPLVTPRLMSGAWTGDLRHLSLPGHALHRAALETRCGVRTEGGLCLVGAGFSLGGLILTKFVGEEGERAERDGVPLDLSFDALLVVNSPLDSPASSQVMRTRTLNKHFYDPNMASGLVAYVRAHKEILVDLPGLSEEVRECFQKSQWETVFARINSIYDYDVLINARANGFDTPDDYYEAVSALKWLPYVRIPVVCVNAADDPVVGPPPVDALRTLMQTVTPNLAYVEVPFGGHLGYVKSPLGEWRQEPSFLETLVVRLTDAFSQSRQGLVKNTAWDGHEPVGSTAHTSVVSFSSLEPEEAQV